MSSKIGAVFFFKCFVMKNGGGKKGVFLGCGVHFFIQGFSRRFLLFFGGGDVFLMFLHVFFLKRYFGCFRCGFVMVGNQRFFSVGTLFFNF